MNVGQLIEREEMRNNQLQALLSEGELPSPEVAKELGIENFYKLARESVEFVVGRDLKLLASNNRLVALLEAGIEIQKAAGKQESDFYEAKGLIQQYTAQAEQIAQNIAKKVMRGYDASW